MAVIDDALKTNITTLGSFVLHISEQLLFFATLVRKTVLKMKMNPHISKTLNSISSISASLLVGGRCLTNWRRAFSCWSVTWSRHGWLYTGLVISLRALWQELAYAEAEGRIRKGGEPWIDKIQQFPVELPNISTDESSAATF
ncbi:3-ketoacyl-CoA synthase 11-like [Henckelia pumila]|uniref:3-ketoacyl-CoA synthase 11-like n=1 Tax=Henckelia pumila TaxID=405737 RepID=UPI003C6DF097